ncbi:MAG: InlB B-repeat-containing protein [Paludibacteraceae bacterium]|nr:InlB B-repeat-containing protein [Paludibacteraceae bacterium]
MISGNASSSKGGGYAAILSVTATAVLAPEIDGDSRMFNDETITLTGYPSGGSWAVVNGPGEIASDGKLTAKGNGTITVSYTVGTASGTKNIEAGVTKTFMFDFTGGAMPEVSGFTLTNLSATFDGANGLKMGSDLQGVRISSEVYEFTNALVSAKANNTSKKVSYNLHDGDQDKTNDPEFATVGTSFAEYNKDIDSQIFTVYRSGGSTTNFNYIVVTAKKVATYTVTFNNNGKGGDAPEAQSGITSGGKATEPTDPVDDNYNFGGWYNKANWQAADAEKWNFSTSTVTRDTTLYAKWTDKSVKSDDATLNAFSIDGYSFTETFAATTLDYTVNMPFYASIPATSAVHATKNDTKANLGDVTYDSTNKKYSVTITAEDNTTTKTYTITLNIASTPTASSSINIEQLVLDHDKKYDIAAAFAAAHIAYDKKGNTDELDSLKNQDGRNEPYLGLKMKKTDASITVVVPASSTLKVKFGNLPSAGIKVTINGVAQANHTSGNFELAATSAIREVVLAAPSTSTIVFKQIMVGENIQSVQLPWLVTYDAGEHGTCETAKETWKGIDLTLPTATPESGWNFDGWKDDENNDATSPYKPTKDVTLIAQYSAQASPFDLTALIYKIGTAEAVNVGYEDGTFTYNIELPYANYDAITVTPTLKVGTSSIKEGAVLTVSSLPGAATFTVVAAGGSSEQLYTINFTKKAKDGVLLIGTKVTGNTAHGTVYGYGAGTADVNVSSKSGDYTYKLNGGKYVGVTLADGLNFQAGDIVKIRVTDKQGATGFTLYTTKTADSVLIMDTRTNTAIENGIHELTLPAYAGSQSLYLLRQNNDYTTNMNPCVDSIAVYRPMDPVLTAITINDVACEKGEGNTFTITLPEEGTNFASLAVEPTVIRNAAHATTPEAVISNSGAWAEGANTYRVMDKDGDYTDYTITITLLGQAAVPVITTQPADVAYCAGNEPTLTVVATGNELHYAWFKEAGETDEAVGEDAASYTIASAGTYYVVVTNKVAGKLDASVTSANAVVTLNVAAAITTQPTNKRDVVAGSEVTLSVVATNATGYQWYSCEDAEKHNAVAISGAEAANYVFTCNANGFYYCVVGNACGDDITSNVVSVKLEPEGCNTFASKPAAEPYNYEQTEEWTFYNVDSNGADKSTDNVFTDGKNFDNEDVVVANTRRFALKFEKDVESVTLYGVGGNDKSFTKVSVSDEMKKNTYTVLTATATKTDLTSQQHIFTIEDMIIPAGKYAWFELSGSLNFFKICYTAALAEPKLPTTLANQELCAGAAYETFDATITNAAACEGTVSYEWYETSDTENPVATTATYTPGADGTYYVVVKHAAAGHATRVAQSANLTVAHFAAPALENYSEDVFQHMGTEATLSVTATGSGLAYAWYTCDAEGNSAEAITGAATASYAIVSIAEGVQYYKVVISNTCDATTLSHIFKVEGWNQLEQVDVTESTVWNMANVADEHINLASMEPSKQNERLLLANIDGVNNNASFNAQALMFEGQHIGRTSNSVKHLAGRYLQFNVTKQGIVSVTFASNGDNQRTIRINDKKCANTTNSGTYITYNVFVQPGSVEIMGMEGASENQYIRIKEMTFTVKETPDYERPVSNNIGTLCVEHNVLAGGALGATFYQIASRNELYNDKIDFEEVMPGEELKAGEPYIFRSNTGKIELFYGDSVANDPVAVRGMIGTYSELHVDIDENNMRNIMYIANNKLWMCGNLVGSYLTMPENRAYIVMSEVPTYAEYTAQAATQTNGAARRRVTLGMNSTNVATGLEDVQGDNVQATKVLIDGQLYILRGEKMYDAKGQLVK